MPPEEPGKRGSKEDVEEDKSVPILKGNKTDPADYQPISILNIIS